jgi:hypothetical protein
MKKIFSGTVIVLFSLAMIAGCKGKNEGNSEDLPGTWVSKGSDLSALQAGAIDSIILYFDRLNIFDMTIYRPGIPAQTNEGNYLVSDTQFGLSQWLILVFNNGREEQGLIQFLITDRIMLQTDLVQTQPDLGHVPPNPELGPGSSSLGQANIQRYVKKSSEF